jgi:arabinofuranosyltransferase
MSFLQIPREGKGIPFKVFAAYFTLAALLLLCYWKIQMDDAYIYYVYARNISSGHGYVFNEGERVNGTTSFLYTIILSIFYAALRWLHFITLPMIGHFIGAASLFTLSILGIGILKESRLGFTPYVFPLFLLLNPLLKNSIGMETFLTLMLIGAALLLYERERYASASTACALAVLSRPDSAIFAALLLIDLLVRKRRLPPLRALLTFTFILMPWVLFNKLYFGAYIPLSLSAKVAQTSSGRWGTGFIFLKGLMQSWNGSLFMYSTFLSLLISAYAIARYRRGIGNHPILLVIIWNLVYLAVYGFVLNPPAYGWYYTPLALGTALIVSLGFETLAARFADDRARGSHRYCIHALIILAFIGLILPLRVATGHTSARLVTYRLSAEWLNENAPAGASVGANEVGILRYYYTKGPVIDALGLVTPAAAAHVAMKDYSWYVLEYRPDYLMFAHPHRPILEDMVEEPWFQDVYRLATIIDPGHKATELYTRRLK